METDILGAIHKKVVQAVEQGETFYEFKKNLLEKLGESGWGNYKEKDRMTGETITRLSDSRLRKIYETNTTQAYHAGAWRGFEETKEALPYLEYKLGPSVHHRDSHAQFNGLILKVDDPFWDTHMPMNGWGCKCWVRQLTEAQAKAKGISKSPKIDYHEWVNPSTGEVKKVPKGLSPGFEYNVGKNRAVNDLEIISNKLKKEIIDRPKTAHHLFDSLVSNSSYFKIIFKKWINSINPKQVANRTMIVGAINNEVITKLKQLGKEPEHTLMFVRDKDILHALRDKKKELGIDLPFEFWEQLPTKLQNPDAVLLDEKNDNTLLFIIDTDKAKIAIKLNYKVKEKISEKKEKFNVNLIRTGSLFTDKTALQDFYVLYGKL